MGVKILQPAGLSNLENKPSKIFRRTDRKKETKDMEGKKVSISERF